MSGISATAWDARGFFQPLLTVLTSEVIVDLYNQWVSKRQEAINPDELELLADLSITIACARFLIAGAKREEQNFNQISELIVRCQAF